MSSTSLLRVATRAHTPTFFRSNGIRSLKPRSSSAFFAVPAVIVTSGSASTFSSSVRKLSDKSDEAGNGHHEESFEEFTARCVGDNGRWHRREVDGTDPPARTGQRRVAWPIANYHVSNIDMRRSSIRCKMYLSCRYAIRSI